MLSRGCYGLWRMQGYFQSLVGFDGKHIRVSRRSATQHVRNKRNGVGSKVPGRCSHAMFIQSYDEMIR